MTYNLSTTHQGVLKMQGSHLRVIMSAHLPFTKQWGPSKHWIYVVGSQSRPILWEPIIKISVWGYLQPRQWILVHVPKDQPLVVKTVQSSCCSKTTPVAFLLHIPWDRHSVGSTAPHSTANISTYAHFGEVWACLLLPALQTLAMTSHQHGQRGEKLFLESVEQSAGATSATSSPEARLTSFTFVREWQC